MKRFFYIFPLIIVTAFAVCACRRTSQTSVVTDAASESSAETAIEQASLEATDQVEFTGTFQILSEAELRDVLEMPSVNESNDTQEGSAGESVEDEYGVIILDEPQTMMLAKMVNSSEPPERVEHEVELILLESDLIDEFRQYDGEHLTFSMDASQAYVYYSDALVVDPDGTFYGPVEHGLPTAVDIKVVER